MFRLVISTITQKTQDRRQNPLTKEITELIAKSEKNIHFVWIPGHHGIAGNETADSAAKEAIKFLPTPNTPVPTSDIKMFLKLTLNRQWQNEWSNLTVNNKLRSIKDTVEPWNSTRKMRREEVVLCRLRLGHTRLTHSFIFEKKPPPVCLSCNKLNLIEHILTDCTQYVEARSRYSLPKDLRDILADCEENLQNLMSFLSETKLLKRM